MASQKTKRPSANQKRSRKTNTTRKSMPGWAQWGLAILCSILLICIIGFLAGRYTLTHSGKESSDELILSFMKAMEEKDSKELKKCLLSIEPNYSDIYEALNNYIQSETDIVTIDYDGMVIETMDPVASDTLEEQMRVSGIEETAFSFIQVPITRSVDGATYYTNTCYYMTAYKAMEKWYLFDMVRDVTLVLSAVGPDGEALDTAQAYRLFNNMMIGGDEEIGFIPLDNTWYAIEDAEEEQTEPIEGAVHDLGYIQESGNAIIHMVLLESDKTPHELADQLYANLTADETANVEVNVAETEINGRTAWHVGFYSQELNTFFFAYIIDTRDYDEKLRYLTLESTGDYTAASLYLTNYLTPDEHMRVYEAIQSEAEETEE